MDYLILIAIGYVVFGLFLNLFHTIRCKPCLAHLTGRKEWILFLILCAVIGLPWAIVQTVGWLRGKHKQCR